MDEKGQYKDLFLFVTDLGSERDLLRRSRAEGSNELVLAQLKAAALSNVTIMLAAVTFFIGTVSLLVLGGNYVFSTIAAPLVVLSQWQIFKIHQQLANFRLDDDPDGTHLRKMDRYFIRMIALGSVCWAGLVCDIWAQTDIANQIFGGAVSFGLIGVGALTFLCMPRAMLVWVSGLAVGSLIGPFFSQNIMPWYYYVRGRDLYGFIAPHCDAPMAVFPALDRQCSRLCARPRRFLRGGAGANCSVGRGTAQKHPKAVPRNGSARRPNGARLWTQLASEFEKSVQVTADAVGSAVVSVGETAQQLATIGAQTLQRF